MIGLFDSGSGGLSVLSALRDRAPHADIVYFGDIKNAPYGIRSQYELNALTIAGVEILRSRGAKEIVSACNSVSQSVLNGAAGSNVLIVWIGDNTSVRGYFLRGCSKRLLQCCEIGEVIGMVKLDVGNDKNFR